jgi:hypothetical protein
VSHVLGSLPTHLADRRPARKRHPSVIPPGMTHAVFTPTPTILVGASFWTYRTMKQSVSSIRNEVKGQGSAHSLHLKYHAVAIAMALALGHARARAAADLDREDARLAAAQLLRYFVDVRTHQPMNRMPTTGLSRTLRLRCWHESGKLGRAGRAGRANVASLGKTAAVRALASRGRGRVTVA